MFRADSKAQPLTRWRSPGTLADEPRMGPSPVHDVSCLSGPECLRVCEKTVASEGRSRSAGAQEPECMLKYMRIPSTAGKPGPGTGPAWRAEDAARDPKRSRFFHKLSGVRAERGVAVASAICIAATNSWCDQALKPPSTSSVAPVMKAASGLARKATAAATSSGLP